MREATCSTERPSIAARPSPDMSHRIFDEGEFWRRVPGYAELDTDQFLDPAWQARSSVRSVDDLAQVVSPKADQAFLDDLRRGVETSSMSVRVSPYIIGLIDWTRPRTDPLRRQFLPLASEREKDHPALATDSLAEQAFSPVPGLTRRYHDKALFLPINTCPVYCSFCTRSYAVGLDTPEVSKLALRADRQRWAQAFAWLSENPEVEDVVVSGGDAFNLNARAIEEISAALLAIPSLRRIRIATKGLAVLPSRITHDRVWTAAILNWVQRARDQGISVAIHTHFNHPNEITWVTRDAAELLFRAGVVVRNQSVLLRGVNDSCEVMTRLIKRLGHLHISPYYVYLHDMVAGGEGFRTSLQTAIDLEKQVRGATAGFHTPTFVVDLPGGGGKRSVHSFESYDRASGRSVFISPAVNNSRKYFYFDPLRETLQA